MTSLSQIFLTPSSISYLTEFLLCFVMVAYLVARWRGHPGTRTQQNRFLISFGIAFDLLTLLLYLDAILLPSARLPVVYCENFVLAVALVFLLQFAYHFPEKYHQRHLEARVVFFCSVLYALIEFLILVVRFYLLLVLEQGHFRPPAADYLLAMVTIWIPAAFFRQALAAGSQAQPWWRKLLHPENAASRAARSGGFVFSMLLSVVCVILLDASHLVSSSIYQSILVLVILSSTWLLASIYINRLPETVSFLVRLTGLLLTVLLGGLGLVGWVVTPQYSATYHPVLQSGQTLHFTPDANGGYVIRSGPLEYEQDLGSRLENNGDSPWKVDFTFPFFGKSYTELYVSNWGFLSLGREVGLASLELNYAGTAAIYPLLVNLDAQSGGGIRIRNFPGGLVLTWDHLRSVVKPIDVYTLQTVLWQDGHFDISLIDLPAALTYNIEDRTIDAPWIWGVSSGLRSPMTFVSDLSLAGTSGPGGVIQDLYAGYRAYLNMFVWPLAGVIALCSLTLLVGFPLLVQRSIVQPLNCILDGIAQIEQGDLAIALPIRANDEIGKISDTFNTMVAALRQNILTLEQRVAERTSALEVINTQLRESEAHFRAVAQTAVDAIITVNQAGSIVSWNRGAETVFGYLESEILGQSLTSVIPARYKDLHLLRMEQASLGSDHPNATHHMEFAGTRKDGSEVPLEMSVAGWVDKKGLQFFTAILRDTTARKQVEEDLRQAQKKMMEQGRQVAALEERERMARDLHDGIGQTLGYINTQVQAAKTLLEDQQVDAAGHSLEGIIQAVQEASHSLRRDILDLRGSYVQLNFFQALQVYLDNFSQRWGVETCFSVPAQSPDLPAAVESQLLHIVQETLTNVHKHAKASHVEVIATLREAEMILIISDDGHGFNPLERVGVEDDHFGVNMMRERAEMIGGQLEIRSEVGRGTQVLVTVPMLPVTTTSTSGDNRAVYDLRILVVDDQPLFMDGLCTLLRARGLTVIGTASDGLQAVEQVRKLRPDVVLMDLEMPNMDGIDATRQIKNEFPETKIIMLTVSVDGQNIHEAVQSGASAYMLKSLEANELLTALVKVSKNDLQLAPGLLSQWVQELQQSLPPGQGARLRKEKKPLELSSRQWDILRLAARGLTYKEIASELFVSEQAIKYHMAQILDRLHLKNREQAVAYLVKHQQSHSE